jgi:16S rRNA processing protein RimM
MAPAGRILVGEIGRPHGVRGLVKLRSFTADPAAIASYGPLTTPRGNAASG